MSGRTALNCILMILLIFSAAIWAAMAAMDVAGQRRLFHAEGHELLSDFAIPRSCAASSDVYHPELVPRVDACYPALAYMLVRQFPTGPLGRLTYIVLAGFVLAVSVVVFVCRGRCDVLAVFACLSSAPVMFSLERGNTMLFAASAVMIFVAFYDSKSGCMRFCAALALGIAVALKVTPVLFGLLYLFPLRVERKVAFRSAALCAMLGAVLFAMPFFWFGGFPHGVHDWLVNAQMNSDSYGPASRWGFVALGRAVHRFLGHDITVPWVGYSFCRCLSILLGIVCIVCPVWRSFGDRASRTMSFGDFLLLLASSILLLSPPMHYYTALLLFPAFVVRSSCLRVCAQDVVEGLCWFGLLCPLQFPFGTGTLNTPIVALSHLALVIISLFRVCDSARGCRLLTGGEGALFR